MREAERIGERWKEKEKGKEWKRERRKRGIMMKKGGVGGEKGGGCKGLLEKEKKKSLLMHLCMEQGANLITIQPS